MYEFQAENSTDLPFYVLISMIRREEGGVLMRCKDLSVHIHKHQRLLKAEQQTVEDLKRLAQIRMWRYNSATHLIEYKGYIDAYTRCNIDRLP
ncbi:MAG: hypothetical protein PHV49_02400 [Alistipes sp.]|nr:hypothetical protein [Alistipes sp.]